MPLPVLRYAQETGVEAGASVLLSFYTDTANTHTRLSNVFTYATVTTKGQYKLGINSSTWLPGNTWHFIAYSNYVYFPFDFYGVGNNTLYANKQNMLENRFKLNLTAEKLVARHFYLGLLTGVFKYSYTVNGDASSNIFFSQPYLAANNGGAGVFAGPGLVWDNRNTNTYTTQGLKLSASYALVQGIYSQNHYQASQLTLQYLQFFTLSKKLTLAFDVYDNNLLGNNAPFYLLPTMGNDELMRGYYNGRYRDYNYTAAQTELRLRLNRRFGLNAFAGTGMVYSNTPDFGQLKPNMGAGLRYFFDVAKGISVRFDYGIGEKLPNESRQKGFYIGLGEAF